MKLITFSEAVHTLRSILSSSVEYIILKGNIFFTVGNSEKMSSILSKKVMRVVYANWDVLCVRGFPKANYLVSFFDPGCSSGIHITDS